MFISFECWRYQEYGTEKRYLVCQNLGSYKTFEVLKEAASKGARIPFINMQCEVGDYFGLVGPLTSWKFPHPFTIFREKWTVTQMLLPSKLPVPFISLKEQPFQSISTPRHRLFNFHICSKPNHLVLKLQAVAVQS